MVVDRWLSFYLLPLREFKGLYNRSYTVPPFTFGAKCKNSFHALQANR
jgi:hypothetical protein